MPQPAVRCLATLNDAQLHGLCDVLLDCVEGDASVGFMQPLARERALLFWRGVADGVASGERALRAAEDVAGDIVGTEQVVLAQPDNQPHRADIAPTSRRFWCTGAHVGKAWARR